MSKEQMSVEILKQIIKERLDVPGFVNDVVDRIAEPALRDAVAKSENKIDDVLVGALYPLVEAELKKQFLGVWDGLLGAAPAVDSEKLGEPV